MADARRSRTFSIAFPKHRSNYARHLLGNCCFLNLNIEPLRMRVRSCRTVMTVLATSSADVA